jgi:hypothetical protein
MTNLERYKADLERLRKLALGMQLDLTDAVTAPTHPGRSTAKRRRDSADKTGDHSPREPGLLFGTGYQQWYSEAQQVVRQLLPARYDEFNGLYEGDPRRKTVDVGTYCIRDWLLGLRATTDYYGEKPSRTAERRQTASACRSIF